MDGIVKAIPAFLQTWIESIFNPTQFLKLNFQPDRQDLTNGIEFFLVIIAVSFLLSAPVAFAQADLKVKAALNALLGLLFSVIVALIWHFPFWLFGGQSSFFGTYLAYVYSQSPYLPFMTLAGLIVIAGLPKELHGLALNPATAKQVFQEALAQEDPKFSRGTIIFGTLVGFSIAIWSTIVLIYCFSVVHNLGGWKLAGATLVSFLITAPLAKIFQRLGYMLLKPGGG